MSLRESEKCIFCLDRCRVLKIFSEEENDEQFTII